MQVCVDVFVTTQTYVDIASISVIPRTTGGQVYLRLCGWNYWRVIDFHAKWVKALITVFFNWSDVCCIDEKINVIF